MDAVNSTGTLIAIQDGPTHVSIRPNPAVGTLQEWIEEGPDSTYTQTMKSVTMKWDDLP